MAKTRKKRITTTDNYIWLLLAMLVLFFCGAVAEQLDLQYLRRLMAMALIAVVLVAVWSLEQDRWPFSSRVGVTLLFIVVECAEFMLDYYHLGTLQITLLQHVIIKRILLSRAKGEKQIGQSPR